MIVKFLNQMIVEYKKPMDKVIPLIVILVSCFGLVMIWSASSYAAIVRNLPYVIFNKQVLVMIMGLIIMYITSLINYKIIKRFAKLAIIVAIVLLVLTPITAVESGGAYRGLDILNTVFQPAEFVKISVLLFMSEIVDTYFHRMHTFKMFAFIMGLLATVCILIYIQPALSTALIIATMILGMYFIGGGNIPLLAIVSACLVILLIGIVTDPDSFRGDRFAVWKDPFADIEGDGMQPAHALMALGSGGLFGKGIGNGRAKLLFLPEPQNDYIFAIIGEELGFLGCSLLMITYFVLILFILKVATGAPDVFSRMYVSGFAILITVQVILNIAVVSNTIPSTGIILPFVSSGGSALASLFVILGITLNISRNIKRKNKK